MNKFILAFVLIASVAFGGATDTPKVFFVGGGGSVKPAATNAVLEAAMAYTDLAISKAYELTEVHINANNGTNYYPSAERVVLSENTLIFALDDSQTLEGECVFELVSPVDTPVYVASQSNPVANKVWQLLLTCGTLGSPIDFDLVITVQPYGLEDKSARQVIFKLRRTF